MIVKIKTFIKKNFFEPVWYSIFFNPYFIARSGLFNKIKNFSEQIPKGMVVLDVGCGAKPYENLFTLTDKYVGIEVMDSGHFNHAKNADQFFDGSHIPFENEKFDIVICTQVLEHCSNPIDLMKEMNRVLKPKGQLFLTMPFVWNEHEIPYDFNRFTTFQHLKNFKDTNFNVISLEPTCGVFGVCGQLISAYFFEKIKKQTIVRVMIVVLICLPIQFIFLLLDFIFKNKWLTLDYVIIAEKYEV